MYQVVDTNVLVTANRKAPQASLACVLACVEQLESLQKSGILVIDDKWFILREYENNALSSGQPGVGDAFLKWILINRTNPAYCEQVTITSTAENEFAEFPKSASLQGFDPSDRKFVAVALAHPGRPQISNAVDSDWYHYETVLADHGIKINFLCPDVTPKP